jgi:hypothetical protein
MRVLAALVALATGLRVALAIDATSALYSPHSPPPPTATTPPVHEGLPSLNAEPSNTDGSTSSNTESEPILSAETCDAASERATVAYLFLAQGAATMLDSTWREYFSGCSNGSFTIHVHSQDGIDWDLQTSRVAEPVLGNLRFSYRMMQAQFKLYREALGHLAPNGCRPRWLQLVSDSHVPLMSCHDTHARLANGPQQSIVESLDCNSYKGRAVCELLKPSHYASDVPFLMASQWTTLTDQDASLLLKMRLTNEPTWFNPHGDTPFAAEVADMGTPDEHYIPNVLRDAGVKLNARPSLTWYRVDPTGAGSFDVSAFLRTTAVKMAVSSKQLDFGKIWAKYMHAEAFNCITDQAQQHLRVMVAQALLAGKPFFRKVHPYCEPIVRQLVLQWNQPGGPEEVAVTAAEEPIPQSGYNATDIVQRSQEDPVMQVAARHNLIGSDCGAGLIRHLQSLTYGDAYAAISPFLPSLRPVLDPMLQAQLSSQGKLSPIAAIAPALEYMHRPDINTFVSLELPLRWGGTCDETRELRTCAATVGNVMTLSSCAPTTCPTEVLADLGTALLASALPSNRSMAMPAAVSTSCAGDLPGSRARMALSAISLLALAGAPRWLLMRRGRASGPAEGGKCSSRLKYMAGLRVLACFSILLMHIYTKAIMFGFWLPGGTDSKWSDFSGGGLLMGTAAHGLNIFMFLATFFSWRKLLKFGPGNFVASCRLAAAALPLRIGRLLPILVACLLLFPGLLFQLEGNALSFSLLRGAQQFCEVDWASFQGGWLRNLLILSPVHNMFEDYQGLCFAHTWYLGADMNCFALLLGLFVVHRTAGSWATITCGALLLGFHWYVMHLRTFVMDVHILTTAGDVTGVSEAEWPFIIQKLMEFMPSWIPAIVGGMLGAQWQAAQSAQADPPPARSTRLRIAAALLGSVLVAVCLFLPLYWWNAVYAAAPMDDAINNLDLSLLVSNTTAAAAGMDVAVTLLSPTLGALGMLLLTMLMHAGWLPMVDAFLANGLFTTIDPWTFCIYMVHVPCLQVAFSHAESPLALQYLTNKMSVVVFGLGTLTVMIVLGAALHVTFERPWAQLLSPPRKDGSTAELKQGTSKSVTYEINLKEGLAHQKKAQKGRVALVEPLSPDASYRSESGMLALKADCSESGMQKC